MADARSVADAIMVALAPFFQTNEAEIELPSEPVADNVATTADNLEVRDDLGTDIASVGEQSVESAVNVPTVMDDTGPLEQAAEQIITVGETENIETIRSGDLLQEAFETRMNMTEQKYAELEATVNLLRQENEMLKGHFSAINTAVDDVVIDERDRSLNTLINLI